MDLSPFLHVFRENEYDMDLLYASITGAPPIPSSVPDVDVERMWKEVATRLTTTCRQETNDV